ncbi:MAG: hypothetical protein IJI14_05795 [Anaerolineaceae bacterium]|nr:hypothetical protein [Anaerolineaceae bacterium]
MSSVIPEFEILYKFPTYYDYCIYMASQWFIDGASPTAKAFLSAFAQLLKMLFVFDPEYLDSIDKLWFDISDIMFKFIPLIIILSILRMVRINAGGSVTTQAQIRSSVLNLIVSIGLAVSCGFIAKNVIDLSSTAGITILHLSGVDFSWKNQGLSEAESSQEISDSIESFVNTYDGEKYNFKNLAMHVFVGTALTAQAAGKAMQIVFIFMRVFLVLVLFISVAFAAVSVRVGIAFLFAISPIVFVLAGYEEISWIRDMWLKGFLGLAMMPTIVGVLLAMIMRMNAELVGKPVSSVDAFKTLGMSVGIAAMIVLIQSTVLTQLLDYSFGTVQKTAKSGARVVSAAVHLPMTIATAATGIKNFAQKKFGKTSPVTAGKALSGGNKKVNEKEKEKEKKQPEKQPTAADKSYYERELAKTAAQVASQYQFTGSKKSDFDKRVKDSKRVNETLRKIFKEKYGYEMNDAADHMQNRNLADFINKNGGVNVMLSKNMIRNVGYKVANGTTVNKESAYNVALRKDGMSKDGYKNIDPKNDLNHVQRNQFLDEYAMKDANTNWTKLANDGLNELGHRNMNDQEMYDFLNARYTQRSAGSNFDFSKC